MVGKLLAGRYEVLDRIGQGGMALVYRARDLALNREVAVKLLRRQLADDPVVVESFQMEARAAASLDGPHVVQVYDVGAEEDAHYIVMELVAGENLKDYIGRHGPLDAVSAVAIAAQIAEALAQAHARHVVHRDIKPQNILLTPDGMAKVTDFGIARAMPGGTLVNTTSMMGTAQYLSPEQARGKPVGPATDLYGLGLVLYEMLVGVPPYDGDSPITVALKHVQDPVPDVRAANPSVPEPVAQLVSRLLEKNPEDRYAGAEAFRRQALRVLRGEQELEEGRRQDAEHQARSQTPPRRGRQGDDRRRRRWSWILGALAVVLLLTGGVYEAAVHYLAESAPVKVPDVRYLPIGLAREKLTRAGVRVVVDGHDYSAHVGSQRVLREIPPQGSSIPKGNPVRLVLSAGPETVRVPSVLNESAGEAATMLSSGFGLRSRVHQVDSTEPAGEVINQYPRPGAKIALNGVVTLRVSNGQAPSTPTSATVPDLAGLGLAQASEALSQISMTVGNVQYVYSTLPANTVIDQSPTPFSGATAAGVVSVVVSKGISPSSAGPAHESTVPYVAPFSVAADSLLKVVVVDSAGNREVTYRQVSPGLSETIPVIWYGISAEAWEYVNGTQQGGPITLTASASSTPNPPGAGTPPGTTNSLTTGGPA